MAEPVMTSELIRAGRMLLRWEQKVLAEKSGVSLPTVGRLEAKPGPLVAEKPTIAKLKSALEAGGIEFTNGGQPGVRLKSPVS
jgi:transcriptional regulator with XRE-family HTH domain